MMKRTAPRSTLRKIIKKHKPQLRLAANADLLVHLNFLLFLHRLAEEARTNAFESKSKIIKPEHAIAAAKEKFPLHVTWSPENATGVPSGKPLQGDGRSNISHLTGNGPEHLPGQWCATNYDSVPQ
nr:PREDICTED: centromere protein W isoform X1 [Apteryx mantelli mantelli]